MTYNQPPELAEFLQEPDRGLTLEKEVAKNILDTFTRFITFITKPHKSGF